MFKYKKLALFFFLFINTIFIGEVAQARPANWYRTRNTPHGSVDQCQQQASYVLESYADWYDWQETGSLGILATSPDSSITILCLNSGSLAAIYCVSNNNNIRETCDDVSNRMTRNDVF